MLNVYNFLDSMCEDDEDFEDENCLDGEDSLLDHPKLGEANNNNLLLLPSIRRKITFACVCVFFKMVVAQFVVFNACKFAGTTHP